MAEANVFAHVRKPSAPAARLCRAAARAGATLLLGVGAAAQAQTMGATGGQFNAGYGGSGNAFNQAINVNTRDANQNSVFVNGMMQAPAGSVFANSTGFSQSTSTGVGGTGMATAIGNNLSVVVVGSYNRVNVDSTQINNGDVSASTSLNGKINLDGP